MEVVCQQCHFACLLRNMKGMAQGPRSVLSLAVHRSILAINRPSDFPNQTTLSMWLRRANMNGLKIAGVALIVAGLLALVYGGFSYTKETHEAKIGPIELSIKDKQTVNVPVWAGVGAIVIGGALLLFKGRSG
jgi:protein-S-isoprenylcysteine O-methyltransferase Ste14